MIDYLEIRDPTHLMDFEGSSNKKPTKKEIFKAVFERGYHAKNISIGFDEMFGFYRFSGELSTITQQPINETKASLIGKRCRTFEEE